MNMDAIIIALMAYLLFNVFSGMVTRDSQRESGKGLMVVYKVVRVILMYVLLGLIAVNQYRQYADGGNVSAAVAVCWVVLLVVYTYVYVIKPVARHSKTKRP